jgi:hypothetical protein
MRNARAASPWKVSPPARGINRSQQRKGDTVRKHTTKDNPTMIAAHIRAAYDARFVPFHIIEGQQQKGSQWEGFRYIHHDKDMVNPRPTAREIKQFISNPEAPWTYVLEIRQGVQLMMFAAGNRYYYLIPLHVQYLAAMQQVSDYYGAKLRGDFDATDRTLAIIRASHIVRDALRDAIKEKGGASDAR